MKPLQGIRVIDLTQAMAAPFCTMNLADMGADVIKIEPPGEGEPTRQLGAAQKNGHSATFMTMNRDKRGIAVDLKQPEGVEIVKKLAATADVFVQNYRPGVVKRLGLDYESLKAINARLIYCQISGFGNTGPYASRGGYDLIAQGMSGVISVTGDEDGPPAKSGIPLADLAAGLFGAYGILSALEYRERTGEGQLVDTSLLEAAMALTVWESAEYWTTGKAPKPVGSAHRNSAPYQALRASDGYFTVGAGNDKLFAGFCAVLERPDLLTDERFATRAARLANRRDLVAEIGEGDVEGNQGRMARKARKVRRACGADQQLRRGARRPACPGAEHGGRPRASRRRRHQGARGAGQALGDPRRGRARRAAPRGAHRRDSHRAVLQ